jgi:hypothetical protein
MNEWMLARQCQARGSKQRAAHAQPDIHLIDRRAT